MERIRIISIHYPDGDHMRVELTETQFLTFQQIMKEEKLEKHMAYEKMLQITEADNRYSTMI